MHDLPEEALGRATRITFSTLTIALFSGGELHAQRPVPATPPDSVPADLGDSTKWVSGGSHYGGTILRDIIVLVFRRGTSQAERQSAIDLVRGSVAGGHPLPQGEGIYLVRVPTDGTIEPLFKAIAALRALPQVSIAMPDEIIFGSAQPVAKR